MVRSHFSNGNSREVADLLPPLLQAIEERTNQRDSNNNIISEVENNDVRCMVNIIQYEDVRNNNNNNNNNGGCECEAKNMEMRILKTVEAKFNTKQIAVLALTIGPIWFVSEVSK